LWGVRNIYYILDDDTGKEYKCLIKGKVIDTDFNIKGRNEVNPIVVGDKVEFEKIDEENGLIISRNKRTNEYKRLKKSGRSVQTLFANIDLIAVVVSIKNHPLRPYFIDRALFTAAYMNIPAMIIFNKIDLLDNKNKEFYKKVKSAYEKLNYTIIEASIITKKGISNLKSILKNKLTSFQW